MFTKGVKQYRGETEVAFHKLACILRAVHSCEVEHEVSLSAESIKQHLRSVNVILEYLLYMQCWPRTIFVFLYVSQSGAEVSANKAFCSGNEDLHFIVELGICETEELLCAGYFARLAMPASSF